MSPPYCRWSIDKSLPVVWSKLGVGFSSQQWWPASFFWDDQCKLPKKLCLALAELLPLSSKNVSSASTCRVLPCLCWGFPPGGCLSCWLFNPHMKLHHLCKQDAQHCEEWRLEHPLAEQDVLCVEQSDRPNWTTCSSAKTDHSFMFTVSSSLEDKNPDFFFYFQAPIKNRKNEIFMMGDEPYKSDLITLNSVSDVFKISLLK